jgi:hypothetical protein
MSLAGLKEQIVRVLPATGALYAAIGLPVNLPGLEFQGVKSLASSEHAQRLLKVSGEIVNLRPGVNKVPPIEIGARRGRAAALSLDRNGTEAEARGQ